MDKKRKKLGLSLKSNKKPTIEKKLDNYCGSILQTQLKECAHQKSLIILDNDTGNTAELTEVNEACNSLQHNKIETKTSVGDEDRERLLWKNLFPLDSADWKDLEDLPESEFCSFQDVDDTTLKINKEIKSNRAKDNNLDILSRTATSDAVNATQDNYVDLPKPCIECYTRKPIHLEYSQEKKPTCQSTENKTMSHLKHEYHRDSNNYHKTHDKDKLTCNSLEIPFIKQTTEVNSSDNNYKLSHEQTMKCTSSGPFVDTQRDNTDASSITSSPSTVIDLTNDGTKPRPNIYNTKLQRQSENVVKTSRTSGLKHTNPTSQLTSCGSLNKGLFKAKKLVTPLGGKGGIFTNKETAKKDCIKCCPMCQLQFPQRMNKQDIDKHISSCIGDEIVIDDDEDEDW